MEAKDQHLDGGDTVSWTIDSIGANEWLHVRSTDPAVKFQGGGSASKGLNSISAVVNYPSGIVPRTVLYSLSLAAVTGPIISFKDSGGDGLSLVIDTLGGTGIGPEGGDCDEDERGDDRHRHERQSD